MLLLGWSEFEFPAIYPSLAYLVNRGLERRHRLERREEEEEGERDHDDVLHDAPLLRPQLPLVQVHPPAEVDPGVRIQVELSNLITHFTEFPIPSFVRFHQVLFWEFPCPAWAVASCSSGPQAGGTP